MASTATPLDVGSTLPDFEFATPNAEGAPSSISVATLFDNKVVVLLSVPGAFTPLCSKQCPSFGLGAAVLKTLGVETVAVTAVNDVFVMASWLEHLHVTGKLVALADGSAKFATAVGRSLDLTERGLGVRGQRYAAIVVNRKVTWLGVDAQGLEKSSFEAVAEAIKADPSLVKAA